MIEVLEVLVRIVLFLVIAGFIIGTIALLQGRGEGRHRD